MFTLPGRTGKAVCKELATTLHYANRAHLGAEAKLHGNLITSHYARHACEIYTLLTLFTCVVKQFRVTEDVLSATRCISAEAGVRAPLPTAADLHVKPMWDRR